MSKTIAYFIKRLALFLIPLILIGGYMEFRMSAIPNSYNKKRHAMEQQLDSISLLVMGDSHSQNDINPSYFSKYAFNMANSSQSIYLDRLLLMQYLSQLPKLTDVIFQISYFTLYFQLDETPEAWRENYYYQFWGIKGRRFNYTDLNNYSAVSLYTFKTSFRSIWDDKQLDYVPTMDSRGYLPNSFMDSANRMPKFGQDRVKVHHEIMNKKNLVENLSLLEDIIQTLQSKNIRVHLISSPVNACYRQYCLPEFEQLTKTSLAQVCKKHNLTYTDFQSDSRFQLEDYVDCDHLNPQGAIKFTKLLNSEVIESRN